jgi:hypothetical protein
MTLDTYTTWYNSVLKECREDGICVPYDVDATWCKHEESKGRICSYESCPRRCKPREMFWKTDGSCTVRKEINKDVELIFFEVPMTLTLSDDKVRFVAKCLTEICNTLKK